MATTPTRAARTYYDDALDDEDEEDEKVNAGWRTWTVMLALASIALFACLIFVGYLLLSTKNDATKLESQLPNLAVQIGFKGEDIQGIGYFQRGYNRGTLALDGLKAPPANSRYILWSVSTKDGTKAVTAIPGERNGSRQYIEVRKLPADLVRLYATVEATGRGLPVEPKGAELFSGTAPPE